MFKQGITEFVIKLGLVTEDLRFFVFSVMSSGNRT